MAVARFFEVWRCSGVDHDALPSPGMVVPVGGSNLVVLASAGIDLDVFPTGNGITLEKVDGSEIIRALIKKNNALMQPRVDSQLRDAFLPLVWHYKPQYYLVHGRNSVGFPGAALRAEPRSKRHTGATLRVVALKPMTIKIAIRNVQVPDERGNIVFHSSTPCDPIKERDSMNAIWTPQANIKFELISSEPALIDTRDRSTREALGRGFGLKDPNTAVLGPEIHPAKVRDVFKRHMISDAHMTFFLVDKLRMGSEQPQGTMNSLGMGFIKGNHAPTTFAHEAGHFLGGTVEKGEWDNHGHTFDKDTHKDVRMLMRDGGAGWKIPFSLVKHFRGFFDRHPVH
jgi:hypothetical protein